MTKPVKGRGQRGWGTQVLLILMTGLLVTTIGWVAAEKADTVLDARPVTSAQR